MKTLFNKGTITARDILKVAELGVETPYYLYDGPFIINRCDEVMNMETAFGFNPLFAAKANTTKALIKLIFSSGLGMDTSSVWEAERVHRAGVPFDRIVLTSQEVPSGQDKGTLVKAMDAGLKYNVCSFEQLRNIAPFASARGIPLSVRVHPGEGGSGESVTRNTANPYSCFGVHISQLNTFFEEAKRRKVVLDMVHDHIGSGGSPEKWKANVDTLLGIVKERLHYLPELREISFGGGLKEARMPEDTKADLAFLGRYSAEQIRKFAAETGKKLVVSIEPGTYIMANAGYAILGVEDKKTTEKGINFVILDGGMEINSRPLLYASKHPFAIVSRRGNLLSSDFGSVNSEDPELIPVGICCESGDGQALDEEGNPVPRRMAEPRIRDYFVVGGCGAYCSTMTPFNYNSHPQCPEVLKTIESGRTKFQLIRRRQTLEQMTQNEI